MHSLPALSTLLAYAMVVGAGLPSPQAGTTCRVSFDGDKFLAVASQRGLEPELRTKCAEASISDNTFYAMPLSACDIVLANARWLAGNAKFQSLQGKGGFTARATKNGLEIRIRPSEGFFLKRVTVVASGIATPCKSVSIDDVLGDG